MNETSSSGSSAGKTKLRQFFDYAGFAFGLIGVIGVGLAIYFYLVGLKDRKPIYFVGKRTTIVDGSISTPSLITVLYKGKPVGENQSVIATTVYFWNAGKMSIKPDNVLEPLSIRLGGSSEILETRLVSVSRNVTDFKNESSDTPKHAVLISFKILEQNDGAAIQIIYAGRPNEPIKVEGTIEEAGNPKELETDRATAEHPSKVRFSFLAINLIVCTLAGVGLGIASAKKTVKRPWRFILFFVAFQLLAMLFLVYYLTSGPTIPSFILQSGFTTVAGSSSF